MSIEELLKLLVLGLVTGAFGGMLGIGGSIIMIPVLIVLGKNMHLAQAVAMIINAVIALPSVWQHYRARAVRWDVFARMLPFGIVCIVIGVEIANRVSGELLKRFFGVFLLYVVTTNILKLFDSGGEPELHEQRPGWLPSGIVGSVMGISAGLLGIGGGAIAVPLLQRVSNLPLRQCISTSAAVMCLTAVIGATRKNMALAHLTDADGMTLGLEFYNSLLIALCLAPTAIVGGLIGAQLTHRLPLKWVRVVFIVLLIAVSANMLGVIRF